MNPTAQQDAEIAPLLFRFLAEEPLESSEQTRLDAWLSASVYNRQVLEEAKDQQRLRAQLRLFEELNEEALWAKVMTAGEHRRPVRRMATFRRWAAAAVFLLLATGIYLWQKQDAGPFPLQPTVMQKAAQAAPGHDGAILTLSNGTQLVLDSLNNGVIATQQGAELVLNKGQLSYKSTSYHPSSAISYNTITTPKGRQFHITLPDGTKVWLNAMSALQYPTTFNGKERTVTCSGEAYFEVAKNAAMPFKVRINDTATIEVLGTAFNVNAYTDESSINTTLLEGSIRINALSSVTLSSVILKKGEQARLTGNRLQLQPQPDLQQVLAWKNGTFSFTKATLPVVLRQLSRWYDVEFEYRGQLRDIKYGGEISRNASLATVLQILNKSDIHFRMEGNKIIVTP